MRKPLDQINGDEIIRSDDEEEDDDESEGQYSQDNVANDEENLNPADNIAMNHNKYYEQRLKKR